MKTISEKLIDTAIKLAKIDAAKGNYRTGVVKEQGQYKSYVVMGDSRQPTEQKIKPFILKLSKVKKNKKNAQIIKYSLERATRAYSEVLMSIVMEKLDLYGERNSKGGKKSDPVLTLKQDSSRSSLTSKETDYIFKRISDLKNQIDAIEFDYEDAVELSDDAQDEIGELQEEISNLQAELRK